jgi:hypothetical protein
LVAIGKALFADRTGSNHLEKILQQYCSPPGWQRVIHHP